MTALVERPPVAGGVALDLPGDGVRLRATRWPGAQPAVLLLHGLASTRHIWDLVVPRLVSGPDAPAVVALDQRGHGDSGRPGSGYDSGSAARDALTALDAVGLSRVVVVGHSWGASVALQLAATSPGRVLACVALDGGLGPLVPAGAEREEVRRRLMPPQLAVPPEELVERLSAGPLAPWWSGAVADALLPLFEVGHDGLARARLPLSAHLSLLDDLLEVDHEALWQAARCPLWLVSCSDDAVPEPLARARRRALGRARELVPGARVLRWEGAVHDVPLQWPALVAGLVRAARDEVHDERDGEGRPA